MSQNETTGDIRSGFKRFTMPVSQRRNRDIESHPGSVDMLDRSELRKLTQILHLDNTGVMQTKYIPRIENLIQNLPKRLRRNRPLSLSFKNFPADLCELHSRLNADLISNVFNFVQLEVTQHFHLLEQWPELCHPIEAEVLRRLRTIKGMWTKPGSTPEPIPNGWPYQINGCRACMLARVASDMDALRNLRVMILSRTRTRRNHRPRTLMGFVDECINQFREEEAEQIYNISSQLAFGMKAARKACTRAEFQKRGLGPRRKHHRSDNGGVTAEQSHRRESKGKAPLRQIEEHKPSKDSSSSLPTVDIWGDDDDQHWKSQAQGDGTQDTSINVGADAVDELVEMYGNIGVKDPYSCETPVPEAMVSPLKYRKSRDMTSSKAQVQAREKSPLTSRTGDEIDGISEQFAGMDLSSLIPPVGISRENTNRTSRRVPVGKQPMPEYPRLNYSGYKDGSDSDWLDDECTDLDEEQNEEAISGNRPKSGAETTWSLVCDQQNMI